MELVPTTSATAKSVETCTVREFGPAPHQATSGENHALFAGYMEYRVILIFDVRTQKGGQMGKCFVTAF
jgi:hypothetical protein